MAANKTSFGKLKDGRPASRITLANANGMRACVTDYGAALVSLLVPDAAGGVTDVIWGFDDVSGYENTTTYMGASIGRLAGQVERGTFVLGGKRYTLVINDHDHTMHGGPDGFHSRLFTVRGLRENEVVLSCLSPDGEAGFPGNAEISVTYRLTNDNALHIAFDGRCDADTVLGMTNHAYFNLDGPDSDSILAHQLRIYADRYTEVDDQGLPTGRIHPVEGTPYDFRTFHTIGERIAQPHPELGYCGGYDHNWLILPEGEKGGAPRLCCELRNGDGTRRMQIWSDQPGLQMYSGNYLTGDDVGKGGKSYGCRSALCLEPQIYPNGLSHAHFPSPILPKGEKYRYRTVYKFLPPSD